MNNINRSTHDGTHKTEKSIGKILLLTGFAPLEQGQIDDMGVTKEFKVITSLFGQSGFRFSVPTVAPAVIGSYFQQRGISVEIKDYYADELHFDIPNIVGISSTFLNIESVKEISAFIKSRNSEAVVVLGGPLTWSVTPANLLNTIPNLDYVVRREGEETFFDLVSAIREGRDISSVHGISYRSGTDVIDTPSRFLLDTTMIMSPAWELMGIPSATRLPVLPVETSRGCLYNCVYCSEVHYWGKPPRYIPVERVVNQIQRNAETFGINTYRFTDSCFSAPPKRCGQVCDLIYDRLTKNGIPVKWSSYARISNLDRYLLEKMKRSGCVALDIGVESGAMDMLHVMKRNYTIENVKNVSKIARELDIITNFNLVIGFPGETENTIQSTIDLINEAAPDTYSCFQFFLAPHSTIYENKELYGIEGEGLSWKHSTMTSKDAAEAMLRITDSVSNSQSFPGGEYCACYLSSLGYSSTEIRRLFKVINQLSKDRLDNEALSLVQKTVTTLKKYC